jgi:hypothetical protein
MMSFCTSIPTERPSFNISATARDADGENLKGLAEPDEIASAEAAFTMINVEHCKKTRRKNPRSNATFSKAAAFLVISINNAFYMNM